MAKDVFGRPTSDKIMFPRAASGTVSIASSCEQVRVYPRRMDRKSVRSTNIPQSPIVLTRKMLEPFFGRPLSEAAEHVGLSITALKSVCRKLGIRRWPYQQSKSRRKAGAADAMSSSSSMSAANMVEVDALGAANKGEMHPQLDRGKCESSMDLCSGVGLIDESALGDEEPLDEGEASAMVTPEYAVRTLAPEHDLRQHVPMYPTPTYMTGCHADSFRCCMPAKAKGLPALPFSHRLQTAPDGPELQLHLLHEDGTKALPHCIDTISEIFGRYCDNANLLEMSFGEALQKSNIDCTMYPHAVVEAMKADFRRKKNRLFGLFSRRKKEARMADLEERQRVLLLQNQFLAMQLEVMEKENVHLHSQEIGSSDPRLAVLSEIAGSPQVPNDFLAFRDQLAGSGDDLAVDPEAPVPDPCSQSGTGHLGWQQFQGDEIQAGPGKSLGNGRAQRIGVVGHVGKPASLISLEQRSPRFSLDGRTSLIG